MRRARNGIVCISVVLWVLAAALWAQSYRAFYSVQWVHKELQTKGVLGWVECPQFDVLVTNGDAVVRWARFRGQAGWAFDKMPPNATNFVGLSDATMAKALMGSYLPPAATTKFLGVRIQASFSGDAKGAFDESYAVAIPFFWLVCVLPACVLGLWLWRPRGIVRRLRLRPPRQQG
jgi:hypothetical protein